MKGGKKAAGPAANAAPKGGEQKPALLGPALQMAKEAKKLSAALNKDPDMDTDPIAFLMAPLVRGSALLRESSIDRPA
jgi:hypothetical protein